MWAKRREEGRGGVHRDPQHQRPQQRQLRQILRRPSPTLFAMSTLALLLFTLTLTLTLTPSPASAMISTSIPWSLSSSSSNSPLWYFRFADQGTLLDISLTLQSVNGDNVEPSSPVGVFLCTSSQLLALSDKATNDICAATAGGTNPPCLVSSTLTLQNATFTAHFAPVPVADRLLLVVINCPVADSIGGIYSATAMNPDGEYLSLDDVPYKPMGFTAGVGWGAIALLWAICVQRYHGYNMTPQWIAALVPTAKAAYCIASLLFWRNASQTGTFNQTLAWAVLSATVVERVIFCAAGVLFAKGYKILVPSVSGDAFRIVILLFLLAAGLVVSTLLPSMAIVDLVHYLPYALLYREVLSAMMLSYRTVSTQFHLVASVDGDTMHLPARWKLFMYQCFHVAIVLYVSIDIVLQVARIVFYLYTTWASDMIEHMLSLGLTGVFFYALLPRPFSPYIYQAIRIYSQLIDEPNANVRALQQRRAAESALRAREASIAAANAGALDAGALDAGAAANRNRNDLALGSALLGRSREVVGSSSSDALLDPEELVHEASLMPLWRPGMPLAPIPATAKTWIVPPEQMDEPLLVLENPFSTDTNGKALPPVYLGEYVSSRSRLAMIPAAAQRYFPRELIELMRAAEQRETVPAPSSNRSSASSPASSSSSSSQPRGPRSGRNSQQL